MERLAFIKSGCACGLLSLLPDAGFSKEALNQDQTTKKSSPIGMSEKQVQEILKFIDASFDDPVREKVFSRLGYECFHSRQLDKWIGMYKGNVNAFLDWVNVEKKSVYWKSLEFNEDRSALILTGNKVDNCACAFANCPDPPKSLCHHCCRNFQQELFGMLLGQKVSVEITKAFLLGDDSCDTLIHLV